MHLVSPAKPGWARPVLSPQQYACTLHPWGASGRLPGRTECDHAPNQWTPRLSEHSQHSRSIASCPLGREGPFFSLWFEEEALHVHHHSNSSSIILHCISVSSGLHHLG